MGGIVTLRDGKTWATTGYIFEQLFRHVIEQNKGDEEVVRHIESSISNQGLSFNLIEDPRLKKRLLDAMQVAASDIVSNRTGRSVAGCNWQLSDSDYEIYLRSVRELLRVLKEATAKSGPKQA